MSEKSSVYIKVSHVRVRVTSVSTHYFIFGLLNQLP